MYTVVRDNMVFNTRFFDNGFMDYIWIIFTKNSIPMNMSPRSIQSFVTHLSFKVE